jgi:chromosomal replication initiator protein
MDARELWQTVLSQIQLTLSPASFATWFKDVEISSIENGQVMISVPNSFVKEWLEQKYHKMIFKILHNLNEGIKEVKYEVARPQLKSIKKTLSETEENQLEFPEFKVDKETNLNSRYSFKNFVVGPFNELAHAAASAVVKNPGQVYNPLFVYGGVGLGKTHLLQAIGNEIVKNFKNKKVKYLQTEKFVSEVISAIRNHQIENLKLIYQEIDVLIIDDVQFLAGKEKTQEEFFYIFNSLYEKNKQIVLSSDRPPKSIPTLTERLRSRFEGGMIADITFPDFETRMAILKSKLQEKRAEVSEEVLSYIASIIQKNIRKLEGALNIIIANQKIQETQVDLKTAKILLKDFVSNNVKILTPKEIIKAVAEFYDISENELLSNSRKKEIVKPRQIAMYLLRECLNFSFPSIGEKFGGKDHTTVIHACEKIAKNLEKNEELREEIYLIKQRFGAEEI